MSEFKCPYCGSHSYIWHWKKGKEAYECIGCHAYKPVKGKWMRERPREQMKLEEEA